MPKTTTSGKAKKSELPRTLQRSDAKAQRTFAKAYDGAAQTYDGDEERANRAAWAAVKRTHEKIGDRWAPKEKGKKGPSDARAAEGGLNFSKPSKGGVDANATKEHLRKLAKKLGVPGPSQMKKAQLVDAIQRANDTATARSAPSAGKRSKKK